MNEIGRYIDLLVNEKGQKKGQMLNVNMNKFTCKIQPYLYPDSSTGYKDKNGKLIKKWFVRYTIEFDEKPADGAKVQYRKEYGKSYNIKLNTIKELKKKEYEARILLQWVTDDLKSGIDPENREVAMELKIQDELRNADQYQYTNVFNNWFASKNYIDPIPSKTVSAKSYYRFQMHQFIPYLVSINKESDIRNITDLDINNYINGNYDSGNWSAFTCNTRIGWLSGVFRYAYKNKLILSNPMGFVDRIIEDKVIKVDNKSVLKERKELRFNIFTDDELVLIFNELKDSPFEAVAETIHYAFLRTSKIFRLKLGDLDLTNNYFSIRASIAKGQRDGGTLTVKIYPPLRDALERYIQRYFGTDRNPEYYLFYHVEKDKPCSYSIFQHYFNHAKKQLASAGYVISKSSYAFKHTGAKKFIDLNKKRNLTSYQIIEHIMKQMRHKDFKTIQKYIYTDLGIDLDEVDEFTFE